MNEDEVSAAARALVLAIREHASLHQVREPDMPAALRTYEVLKAALEQYQTAVGLQSGWGVPYSVVADDGDDEWNRLDDGQTFRLVAEYVVRLVDPKAAIYEARVRQDGDSERASSLAVADPHDPIETLRAIYEIEGWKPSSFGTNALQQVGAWTVDIGRA